MEHLGCYGVIFFPLMINFSEICNNSKILYEDIDIAIDKSAIIKHNSVALEFYEGNILSRHPSI